MGNDELCRAAFTSGYETKLLQKVTVSGLWIDTSIKEKEIKLLCSDRWKTSLSSGCLFWKTGALKMSRFFAFNTYTFQSKIENF
ncbi:MAG: hypothetical protein ACP5JO_02630 [Candidatus Ratteibacteria bacterium]